MSTAPGGQGWAVWSAGLVVVIAAGAATAHGLYEVALGSGTPPAIAWLYPVITDGLALVAYAATSRLRSAGRRYAWAVVVLAAGLSGLAQATYLAGGLGTASPQLRFGVGAWPAIAAAIAAHLLFLIGTHRDSEVGPGFVTTTLPVGMDTASNGSGCPTAIVPFVPSRAGTSLGRDSRTLPEPGGQPELSGEPEDRDGTPGPGNGTGVAQAERARAVAARHADRTGELPTVRELAELAEVGRGTAGRALAALRAAAPRPDPTTNGHRPTTNGQPTTNRSPGSNEKDTQR